MLQNDIDWTPIFKIYGPLGLFCVIGILFAKRLLNYIQKQHEEHIKAAQALADEARKAAQTVADDARKERDYTRALREREVEKFLESLKLRDEKMERGFDEVVNALREARRK